MNSDAKFRVLIADDSRLNIVTLSHILEPFYDVIIARDGREAVEAAEKYLPDIIVLDIIMPELNGFEVLTRLKSSEQTKNIPVIFITGLDYVEDEEKGFALGAVDYITRPFHASIVQARVKTHLRMARYISTIESMCMIDTLTELSNRRGFNSRMEAEWGHAVRNKTPLGILLLDIDRFKVYNDTYGHTQGDVLLHDVAKIFQQTLQRSMDFVARWGGEEFIVLLPNTDLNGSLKVAEQIRRNVERAVIPAANGVNTSVTVSIGLTSKVPRVDDEAEAFINLADQALYTAKNSGRNRVCSI